MQMCLRACAFAFFVRVHVLVGVRARARAYVCVHVCACNLTVKSGAVASARMSTEAPPNQLSGGCKKLLKEKRKYEHFLRL